MLRRVPAILRRHPVAGALAAACLCAAVTFASLQAIGWAEYASFVSRSRSIAATATEGPLRTLSIEFRFRGLRHRVTASAGKAYLTALAALPTEKVFYSEGAIRSAYVSTLVHDQAAGPVVAGLARGLRGLRRELRLDDDEYVELIAACVQSIRYGVPAWRIRLPALLVADGEGVCSDRSILLASLLVHEGYDSCVWVFGTEHHVAVGVRGLGSGFHGSGYAYIETTTRAFVTDAAGAYAAAGQVAWAPQIIRVGGVRRYGADVAAQFVTDRLERVRMRDSALSRFQGYARTASDPWRQCYAGLAREHAATSDLARRIAGYVDDRPAAYALLTASGLGR
jgi:hypothetical protein